MNASARNSLIRTDHWSISLESRDQSRGPQVTSKRADTIANKYKLTLNHELTSRKEIDQMY